MFELLKTIHLLSLYAGGGAAIGSAVLAARAGTAAGDGSVSPRFVAGTMAALGRIGLVAILAIWASGLAMVWREPFLAGGWVYWIKLLGAVVALLAVLALARERWAAARSGSTPEPARMKLLGQVAMAATIATVIFAVIAFN
ncbi:hypothetical protein SAMN05216257_104354 [Meinhardsimonia xiamenensis]|jgi:hypothetical protein|uniref:Copper resistance protein D n=1 Tax=Meinhardsimonia xiamenensis TaxID=990712 RepID=A0A1G9EKA3_9RHOB|nr:hypothetical protein [Meinhardsimonia xiamenensis]PRX33730.1 hypothetical protein LV81_02160 [Meinhardsimonia xiamenensis]SDK76590.1 hypothetical protein SAMN05216257_104354 [Meinhardsimonia xiamenensis]